MRLTVAEERSVLTPHPWTAPWGQAEQAGPAWRRHVAGSPRTARPEPRPHLQQRLVSKGHDAFEDDDVGAVERLLQREGAVLVPARIRMTPAAPARGPTQSFLRLWVVKSYTGTLTLLPCFSFCRVDTMRSKSKASGWSKL